jgi:RimJ/RimL family protein N-acetyltransferase
MIPRKLVPHKMDIDRLVKHFYDDIRGDDRRLRFGNIVNDDIIERYICDKSFEHYGFKNMWFVVEDGCNFVASCHVAYDKKTKSAELGLTVSPDYRDQKIGQELFNRGAIWARAMGSESLFMHCLSENKTIQHIAKKNNMTIVTLDSFEKEATIKISKNQFSAGIEDAVLEQMALYDSSIRNNVWSFIRIIESFTKR